jgi:outer membrane immunogenic protein
MEFIEMRKLIVAALAASTLATPALAEGRGPFTGVRVEGLAGWDRPQANGDHADGVAYGVGAGFDFQAGGAVLGIEGEASKSTAKECIDSFAIAGDRLCSKTGRDLYVGGRVGGVVGRATLLYAKAGYTNARSEATYNSNLAGSAIARSHANLDGFRVGAGVEQAVGRKAFVKAEYRYSNYEQGVDRHQVVAGLGIRF